MPCTTILVGKNASYDGSTLVARNEDSSNGVFEPKRMRVVHPDEQPRVYTSVLSHLTVELPDNPMRYTSVPDVVPGHGIWAEAGFNELNVGMSATDDFSGDLVFFLDYETMDGIGHCGIYVGDGNFIHASSGSGYCVKVSTLTSGSYAKRYSTARRLI